MRRRLINTYLLLLTLVLLALELPLMWTVATQSTGRLVIDRLLDASGYASLAEASLGTNQMVSLRDGLDRYYELYGIAVAVANRDGELVAMSGERAAFDAPEVRQRLRQALAGDRAGGDRTVWPWQSDPLIVAVPVTSGTEVIGAVVSLSPTDRLRDDELRIWSLATVAGLVALAVFGVVAVALTRWVLRPVAELDGTAHRLAEGTLDARVAADLGPLTSLRIRVDNLADYVEAAGRDEHRLTLEEVDRFATILDSLLALARAERGRHVREEVDAALVADDRVNAWRPLAEQRGIELCRTGAASAPAQAVVTAVDQALDALIDNALKFAGPGARVSIDVRTGADSVDVHVIDNGPGLSDEDRRRATERFWRAPDAQNLDGSGLGLPIATVLVEASGGTLTLHAAQPCGPDAQVTFPASVSLREPAAVTA